VSAPLFTDTIAAIATPRGAGGVGVVRVSGSAAVAAAGALVPRGLADVPSHTVRHAWLRNADGAAIDEALVTVMRAPRTFTGEDVVEIGVHGGSVVARRVLEAVLASGARLADPGEFTRRAFLNGRIDLTQAEAVADLVAARTGRAADAALAGLAGRLAGRTTRVEASLLDLLARLEVNLDFNEDVQAVDRAAVGRSLAEARAELEALAARAPWGRRLRDGALVVLVGDPNVGKSSLFNALLEDDRALVSETPGTTRDYLEAWIDVDGLPVRLVDTAGLREDAGDVEAEGVRRARGLGERADLRLHVTDLTRVAAGDPGRAARGAGANGAAVMAAAPVATIRVGNKSDLVANGDAGGGREGVEIRVSARTGEGVADLRARIAERLGADAAPEAAEALPGERHEEAIRRACRALELAEASWREGATEELIAGDVRDAASALGEITGKTVGEEVLDRIFSKFCVGK